MRLDDMERFVQDAEEAALLAKAKEDESDEASGSESESGKLGSNSGGRGICMHDLYLLCSKRIWQKDQAFFPATNWLAQFQ